MIYLMSNRSKLDVTIFLKNYFLAVLDGELAVPCNLQSAIAGSMPTPGCCRLVWKN